MKQFLAKIYLTLVVSMIVALVITACINSFEVLRGVALFIGFIVGGVTLFWALDQLGLIESDSPYS